MSIRHAVPADVGTLADIEAASYPPAEGASRQSIAGRVAVYPDHFWLLEDFHGAVDDYLELCRAEGKTPETAYKGSFNVRISPELHKQLAVYAMEHNVSLNHCVEQALEKALAQK